MARSPRRDQSPEGIYVRQDHVRWGTQVLHFYYETPCFYYGRHGRLCKTNKAYVLTRI